jgi:perosamine synthetase
MGNEKKYVLECLDSNWISSSGKYIHEFEEGFAKKVNRRFGVGVCNGTMALILAIRALNLPKGSEVICPAFCMAAPIMAVINEGLNPVFVDVDNTWNIEPDQIAPVISDKTSAILVVHNYGLVSDFEKIQKIAEYHQLKIIEDAAEAHGAFYHERPAGSFGNVSCFSFYANKIITTGEGGMIVTDDADLADRLAYFKNMCFSSDPEERFLHNDVGFNLRMTNIQAAIGLAQLENFDRLAALRIKMGETYIKHLADVEGVSFRRVPDNCRNVFWMFGILIDENIYGCRDDLMKKLKDQGIETRRFFYSADEQPFIIRHGLKPANHSFPVSRKLSQKGFYLPSSPTLNDFDICFICSALKNMGRV